LPLVGNFHHRSRHVSAVRFHDSEKNTMRTWLVDGSTGSSMGNRPITWRVATVKGYP
jgi:hypothetical protein